MKHLGRLVELEAGELKRQHVVGGRNRSEAALQRRNRELELLNQAVQALTSTLDVDQVLRNILDQTRHLLGAAAASAWLVAAEPEIHGSSPAELVCRQAVGLGADGLRGWRLPPGAGVAGWVASRGESLIVPDTRAEVRHSKEVDRHTGVEVRSVLCVPLRMEHGVLGVIQVVDPRAGHFASADLRLMESLAGPAAIALGNARLYQQAQEEIVQRVKAEAEVRLRNRELTLLNRVIAASASEPEPAVILETACRELAHGLGVSQATAALLDERKTEARVIAEYLTDGRPSALGQTMPVAGNPIFQHLLTHRSPLAVGDALADPRSASMADLFRQRGTVSLLALPLTVRGEVVGALSLEAIEPHDFSAWEIGLAWGVADQIAGLLARTHLAQAERRLSAAVEQAAEAVMITDAQGTIQYVNPAFERITGYSIPEAVGQTPRLLKSGEQDADFYQDLWVTISAGSVWHGRLVNQRKDGTRYVVDTTITPVRDEHNRVVNYVSLQRDVTREVELEEQYRHAQKMEALGQLTAGIAHDFNNLLTAINGFTELMQLQLPPDALAQELTGKILGSGKRAAELVRRLLAFSRKQVLEPQILDLNRVVNELDSMLGRVIGEHIDLRIRLVPDLWPVQADPAQLEQVIVNLAVNARDAMPEGGRLTIETANATLDEDYAATHLETQPGEHVVLAVTDTGTGMSAETKAHIFEPFFTTKTHGQGTGLGLATVYGIVKQSGGSIWVYSEEGVGTTFKIYLPRAQGVTLPVAQPDVGWDMLPGSETILLVEDDDQVRELALRVLRSQGYTLLEASDAGQALQVAAEHSGVIDLLVADVVIPGMGGRKVSDRLTRTRPHLKTLFISGYTAETVATHDVWEQGFAFLPKPFGPLALARKVRQVLDSSQSYYSDEVVIVKTQEYN